MKNWLALTMLLWPLFLGSNVLAGESRRLVILFTHDLHSYFLPHKTAGAAGAAEARGGYAKLAFAIQEARKADPGKTLLVDAGDIVEGTLFQTAFPTEASELRLMGRMGYDVITLGNHDFDFYSDGLAEMLRTAAAKNPEGGLPRIVFASAVFSPGQEASDALATAFGDFPVQNYAVLEKNGLRIGFFGIMGKDAASDTPFAKPVGFSDPVADSRRMVDLLRNQEKADLVVCLSHAGTSPVPKHSEDEAIAKKVAGIDVIISGHTHRVLPEPLIVGRTIIVSAGCYGAYLGILALDVDPAGGAKVASYELKAMMPAAPEDPGIAREIEGYKKRVEEEYLSGFHYRFDQTLAESGYSMESLAHAYSRPGETGLGNLIADAFQHAVTLADPARPEHVHAVVIPIGHIRDTFYRGAIAVSDVFQVLSLGLDLKRVPGDPLTAFYVTGRELKSILEVETTVSGIKDDAHLQVAGVKFSYNPHRMPFERVTAVQVREPDGRYLPLDPDRRYRVCVTYFALQMIEYIHTVTHGLIRVVPKDREGRPIKSLGDTVVYEPAPAGRTAELKAWVALARFLQSFPDRNANRIPDVPDRYRRPEGRISRVPSWNPADLVAGGGVVTYGVLIAGLGAAALIVWVVVFATRRIRKGTSLSNNNREPAHPIK